MQAMVNKQGVIGISAPSQSSEPTIGAISQALNALEREIDDLGLAVDTLRQNTSVLMHTRGDAKSTRLMPDAPLAVDGASEVAQQVFKKVELLREQRRRVENIAASIDS